MSNQMLIKGVLVQYELFSCSVCGSVIALDATHHLLHRHMTTKHPDFKP